MSVSAGKTARYGQANPRGSSDASQELQEDTALQTRSAEMPLMERLEKCEVAPCFYPGEGQDPPSNTGVGSRICVDFF